MAGDQLRKFTGVIRGKTASFRQLTGHAEFDEEVLSCRLMDGVAALIEKPDTVFHALGAVFVRSFVIPETQESSKQSHIIGHVNHAHIEAQFLQDFDLIPEILLDLRHDFLGDLFRGLTRLEAGAGTGHAAYDMIGGILGCCRNFHRGFGPIEVDGVCQLGQVVLRVSNVQVIGHVVLVRGDRVGSGAGAGHHGSAALCLVCIVGDDGLSGIQLAALKCVQAHGSGKQPVSEYHISHLERGK